MVYRKLYALPLGLFVVDGASGYQEQLSSEHTAETYVYIRVLPVQCLTVHQLQHLLGYHALFSTILGLCWHNEPSLTIFQG